MEWTPASTFENRYIPLCYVILCTIERYDEMQNLSQVLKDFT